MMVGLAPRRIITAIIGTAMTQLISALHNSARIGSTRVKLSNTPPTVANAETTSPPIRKRASASLKGFHAV